MPLISCRPFAGFVNRIITNVYVPLNNKTELIDRVYLYCPKSVNVASRSSMNKRAQVDHVYILYLQKCVLILKTRNEWA
jgi:hypothetical protein